MLNNLLLIFIVCCMLFLVRKSRFFRLPGITANILSVIFLFRIAVAIAGWMLYSARYPDNDAGAFIHDSQELYKLAFTAPGDFFRLLSGIDLSPALNDHFIARTLLWGDSSRTVIRLNALICFFSNGFFYVHAAVMTLIAFAGQSLIYRSFFPFLQKKRELLMIGVFLLPSLVFWTSAVSKESLLIAGIGLLLYCSCAGSFRQLSAKKITGFAIGVFILVMVKPYVLIAFLPALAAQLIVSRSSGKPVLKYLAVIVAFLLLAGGLSRVSERLDLRKRIAAKQLDFRKMARGGVYLHRSGNTYIYVPYSKKDSALETVEPGQARLKSGSAYALFTENKTDTTAFAGNDSVYSVVCIVKPAGSNMQLPDVSGGFKMLLIHAPAALVNALIVPGLFLSIRPFAAAALIANFMLVIFLLIGLCFLRRKEYDRSVVLFCLTFSLLLLVLIGFTTPVVGAMLRYRVPALPFLFCASAMMIPDGLYQKLKSRFSKGG